jgi:hypothetical protein
MILPGEEITCRGRVVKKYTEGKEHYLECELWAENPKGEKVVPGSAVVVLPSKGKASS